jgi:hypothetical protein
MSCACLRGVERDLRHAARAHPGPRQAGGGARPARAAAAARGAASDRARVGDRPAAGARRLGGARRRARSAHPRGVVEHSDGRVQRVALAPDRPVGEVTREVLEAVRALGGAVEIDPTPQEVPWSVPLDEDDEHARYDPARSRATSPPRPRGARPRRVPRAVSRTLDAGQRVVGLVRPRGEPVLGPAGRAAVGRLHHAQRDGCAGGRVGWWPGDPRYGKAAFYAYAHPAPEGFAAATLSPAARAGTRRSASTSSTGTMSAQPRPACGRARVRPLGVRHACAVCAWDPALAASAEGSSVRETPTRISAFRVPGWSASSRSCSPRPPPGHSRRGACR